MVNLSIGLAYVHYGLKRQSTNRQYILLQGQAFIARYTELCRQSPGDMPLSEVYYNLGRLFQLLGIGSLAWDYYSQAMQGYTKGDNTTIRVVALLNKVNILLLTQNKPLALNIIKKYILL